MPRPNSGVLGSIFVALALLGCAGDKSTDDKTPESKTPESKTPDTKAEEPAPEPTPSNDPAKTYGQLWSTPSGHATASIAAVAEGRIYALAGAYVEFGAPASNLVCLAAAEGKILWDFAGEGPMSLEGIGPEIVELSDAEGGFQSVVVETGKGTKPTKAQSDATKPPPEPPAHGCTAKAGELMCEGWQVSEQGSVTGVRQFGEQLCYALSGSREIRCRAAASGDLHLVVAVPAVPEVKDPEAVNFSFELVGDQLFVANYDGTILAYGP